MATETEVAASPVQAADEAVVIRAGGIANVKIALATLNPQSGAAYAAAITDAADVITMDNAAANQVTIPLGVFPQGTQFLVCCKGAGVTTVKAAAGVTLNGIDGGQFQLQGPAGAQVLYFEAVNAVLAFNRTDVV